MVENFKENYIIIESISERVFNFGLWAAKEAKVSALFYVKKKGKVSHKGEEIKGVKDLSSSL